MDETVKKRKIVGRVKEKAKQEQKETFKSMHLSVTRYVARI